MGDTDRQSARGAGNSWPATLAGNSGRQLWPAAQAGSSGSEENPGSPAGFQINGSSPQARVRAHAAQAARKQ